MLELDASIQARNAATGFGSWFRRIVRVKRGGGAPILKPVVTPAPDDDETGSLTVTAAHSLSPGQVPAVTLCVEGIDVW
jgi:hypothetical protein